MFMSCCVKNDGGCMVKVSSKIIIKDTIFFSLNPFLHNQVFGSPNLQDFRAYMVKYVNTVSYKSDSVCLDPNFIYYHIVCCSLSNKVFRNLQKDSRMTGTPLTLDNNS